MKFNKKVIGAVIVTIVIVLAAFAVLVYQQGEPDDQDNDDNTTPIIPALAQPEYHEDLVDVLVENDTIVYTYDSDPGLLNYTVGSIIVGPTGYGYLRKITEVQQDGKMVTVTTEQAALADILTNQTVHYEQNLTLEQAEITQFNSTRGSGTGMINLGAILYKVGDVEVKIEGSADIDIHPVMSAHIGWNGLDEFSFTLETDADISLTLTASSAITLAKEKKLFTFSFPTVCVLTPFPIWFTPQLEIAAGAEISFQSSLTTSISLELSTKSGIQYSNGQWSTINECTKQISYITPQIGLMPSDGMGYGILPRFQLMVYDLVGPFADLKPYLNIHAAPSENPWWALSCGLKGNVGAKLAVFDNTLASVSWEVFDLEWPIASAPMKIIPDAPQNPAVIAGDKQVSLSWQAPASDGGSAITGYKVYRGTTSNSLTYLTTTTGMTYTNTGLTNGQIYYYKISAVNAIGESAHSTLVSATPVSPATVPTAPQSLTATPGNTQIVLDWQAPASNGGSTITNYKIYQGTTSGSLTLLTTVDNVLTYTNTGLTNGQVYYYQVSAVNVIGEGAKCTEASATPTATTLVPTAPQNLVAAPGDTQVVLNWQAPTSDGGSAITDYMIYQGTTSGGETLLTTVGNVLTYTDTGLTNGQPYYYKVSAVNAIGEGPQSNEASATPEDTVYIPGTPFRINSNADFVTYANGGGDGSVGNPWIIEDLDINGTGHGYCIYIGNTTDYFVVRDCYLHDASGNLGFYFWNSGIALYKADNGKVANNTVSKNSEGIFLYSSSSNTIANNTASNNWYGIWLYSSSSNNSITNNTASSNYYYGIHLDSSSSNTIANNTMVGNGISIFGNILEHWNTHTIDISNTVNGKPVYYWKNQTSGTVFPGAGQVILANCSNVIIENQNVSDGSVGIALGFSSTNTIANNTIANNCHGIYLEFSNSNIIANNNANLNYYGIHLDSSSSNTITNNTANSNYYCGIYIVSSNSNTIANNTIANNNNGIYLDSSNSNIIANNTVSSNNNYGILLWYYNSNNAFTNNTASNNGVGICILGSSSNAFTNNIASNNNYGILLGSSSNNAFTNNTASNNDYGISLEGSDSNIIANNNASSNNDYGIYLCSSSNNNTIANNTASLNNYYGIYLDSSSNNTVANNTANSNNNYGIYLAYSNDNTIFNNTISNNSDYGIYLFFDSNNNTIYHNNIINNTNQAYDDGTNQWDNGYPDGGNYWSDYAGVDDFSGINQDIPGSDGIGDTPYAIPGGTNQDNYPLMNPVP